MSLVQAKKKEISELWGLSILEIDSKLSTLQAIICDESDHVLLDYLLKADLNIDQAINLHFGNTPSPLPPSNNNSLINKTPSLDEESNSNTNHHRNNNSIIDTTSSLDESNGGDDEDSDMLLLNPNSNINNNNDDNVIRKRKRHEIDEEDIDMNIARNKRRKIDINNDNTNNSNSNNNTNNNTNSHHHSSSMKMEQDSDEDIEDLDNNINIYDPNWKTKLIGTLKIEYTQSKPCSVAALHDLSCRIQEKKVNIENAEVTPCIIHKNVTNELYEHCIRELRYRSSRTEGISIRLTNRNYIEGSRSKMASYKHEYNKLVQKEREYLLKARWGPKDEDALNRSNYYTKQCEERAKSKLITPGTFTMEFEITLKRSYNLSKISFSEPIPYTMALFGGSRKLLDKIMSVINIDDEYEKNKHVFSMVSLLDFACRYKYKINEMNNNESYNHGLNLKLHEYQLQSLDFMITEENHPIGFYRHFYEKGKFNKNTPFIYSATFNSLIVNEKLPIAHGGLLCDEMGLGKTIISLALINCNKPSDLNGYSTKNILQIGHSEMMKKSRWEESENGIGRRILYNEEYKWYKSRATLIIAPVSLIGEWEKECDQKSVKKIKYKRYYGLRSRDIKKYIDEDIVFTTYGILGVENGDDRKKHVLHQIEWHRIILDESHYIKNPNCKTSKNINKLRGINKWCLTGTPFGTQIYDIYNQLKFVGLKREHLDRLSLQTISKDKVFDDGDKSNNWRGTDCNGLMHVIQSMVMRHKKAQKFNNKPIVIMTEKKEDVIFIDFTLKQREYYDKLYNAAKERYIYYKSIGNIGRGTISILSSLHPARQACSGYIYSKENIEQQLSDAQAKTFRIRSMVQKNANFNLSRQELFKMAKHEAFNKTDGECPICYECPFDDPLQTPCRHIFCGECIGSILENKNECPMCRKKVKISQLKKPPSKQQENDKKKNQNEKKVNMDEERKNNDDEIRFDSKLKVLINELNKIRENGRNDKSLIFTSFSKSLTWICNELKKNGFEYRTLTGSMSMNKRKKELDEFSNNNNVNIFVLTVRSGAVGITLNAANHVFMLEPPFNAALHRQAINRVYRLGQKKNVFIHTLIIKDSIEEKIWNINKNKQSDNNDNDDNNNDNNLAGNISTDKNAKLQQHEISKLFQ